MQIKVNTGDLLIAIKRKMETPLDLDLPKTWKKQVNKQAREYIQNILNKIDLTEYDCITANEITLKTISEKEVYNNQIMITLTQADNSRENIHTWNYQAQELRNKIVYTLLEKNIIAYGGI